MTKRGFAVSRQFFGQLDTDSIVGIVDVGSDKGPASYVMPYIDGSHIDIYCREQKLSVAARLCLFLRVCDAVSLAHDSRIVHRDLKPANILVDKTGSPKLIDRLGSAFTGHQRKTARRLWSHR